jgi:hypothetical protein
MMNFDKLINGANEAEIEMKLRDTLFELVAMSEASGNKGIAETLKTLIAGLQSLDIVRKINFFRQRGIITDDMAKMLEMCGCVFTEGE